MGVAFGATLVWVKGAAGRGAVALACEPRAIGRATWVPAVLPQPARSMAEMTPRRTTRLVMGGPLFRFTGAYRMDDTDLTGVMFVLSGERPAGLRAAGKHRGKVVLDQG
ncbi:hypothetical protein D3C72_1234440 [compost metagenome]